MENSNVLFKISLVMSWLFAVLAFELKYRMIHEDILF